MYYYFFYGLTVLLICLVLRLNIDHPVVITFGIWTLLPLLYNLIGKDLYPLSKEIYNVLFLFTFSFLLGYFFSTLIIPKFKSISRYENLNLNTDNFIFLLSLLCAIYEIVRGVQLLHSGTNIYQFILDNESKIPPDLLIAGYFETIAIAFYLYTLCFCHMDSKKIVLSIFLLFAIILRFGKLKIMRIFISTIVILFLKKKIKFSQILLLGIAFLTLMIIMQFSRGSTRYNESLFEDIIRMLSIYLLSPFKALDNLLQGKCDLGGGHIFRFWIHAFAHIGIKIPYRTMSFDGWTYVPVPTNVYTSIAPLYSDFGINGVSFFAMVEGMFWGILYRLTTKKFYLFLYINLLWVLYIQFFDDILFSYRSTIIIIVIASLFVYYGCMGRYKKLAKYIFKLPDYN